MRLPLLLRWVCQVTGVLRNDLHTMVLQDMVQNDLRPTPQPQHLSPRLQPRLLQCVVSAGELLATRCSRLAQTMLLPRPSRMSRRNHCMIECSETTDRYPPLSKTNERKDVHIWCCTFTKAFVRLMNARICGLPYGCGPARGPAATH